jgi:hypothetical protein
MPTFVPEMPLRSCPLQFLLWIDTKGIFAGIKARYRLTDDLFTLVPINAFCSGIPGHNPTIGIEQVEGIIVNPLWVFTSPNHSVKLLGFVTQGQYMTHRQDVSLRHVLKFSHAPVGTYQPERALLFASFEEGPP